MGYRKSTVGRCCIKCTDRYPGCHDHCEKFLEAKRREKEDLERIKKATKVENQWIQYKSEIFSKEKKK